MKIKLLLHKKQTEVATVELPDEATVEDLNQAVFEHTRIAPLRQRLSHEKTTFVFGKKIRDLVPLPEFEVTVKDLGPQLPYKTLFVLEYLGPLLSIPFFYLTTANHSLAAKFGAALGILHFLKRELESEFVHIFSNASVPVSGSVKNIVHYWGIFGLLVVGELFHFTDRSSDWPVQLYWLLSALFVCCEFMNYRCHLVLRNLRLDSAGAVDPHKRGVPAGWGFQFAHCANYSWEILAWMLFAVMTKTYASYLFLICASYIMGVWALKKKALLLKSLGRDHPQYEQLSEKNVLFPGLF